MTRPVSKATARHRASAGRVAGVVIATVLAGSLQTAWAAGNGLSTWNVSGFGTVGAVTQFGGGDWRLIRGSGQPGARSRTSFTEDSRAGLQLNWRHGPDWDAVLQVVALKRPQGARALESLEWASVGYRPMPGLRVRLGRTNTDFFLLADTRNVGFALPWVRPPVDFYGFSPVASFDGGDVEWQFGQADANWRARLAAGQFSATTTQSTSGDSTRVTGRNALALTLARESEGLTLKASYVNTDVVSTEPSSAMQFRQALTQLAALPVPAAVDGVHTLQEALSIGGSVNYLAFGLQYETGPWSLLAEASDLRTFGTMLPSRRGYLSLGYRTGVVTVYGLVSRSLPRHRSMDTPDLATSLTPVIGPAAAAQAQMLATVGAGAANSLRSDQRTLAVGLRWDVAPSVALKFQLDQVHVFANGAGSWLYGGNQAARITLASVALDFAWGQ